MEVNFRKSFKKHSNSQYDRVSPSFFGDRWLDGYAFVWIIAIPEGMGFGVRGVCEFGGVFGFLDD